MYQNLEYSYIAKIIIDIIIRGKIIVGKKAYFNKLGLKLLR